MSKSKVHSSAAQAIIDGVPDNSKYSVLNSLVGSINCSVIGTANSLVGRLERQDHDFTTLSPIEVIHMMGEADMRSDALHNVRTLMRVRDNLRDQLLVVSNDSEIASWNQSLEFMMQPSQVSRINDDKLAAALGVCGLDESTSKLLAVAAKSGEAADRVRSAEQLASRQGAIEWLIEHVFSSTHYYDELGQPNTDTSTDDTIEALPAEVTDRLYDKLRISLDKARTRAVQRFALNDSRYTIGDIMSLSNSIKEAEQLESHFVEA